METRVLQTFDQVTFNTKNTTESAIEFGEMLRSLISEACEVIRSLVEIRTLPACRLAVRGILEVAKLGYDLIDKIDDLNLAFQRSEFKSEIEKIESENFSFEKIKATFCQTRTFMENCHHDYLIFDEKCKEVAVYCARAAGACSRMADEAKTKKM